MSEPEYLDVLVGKFLDASYGLAPRLDFDSVHNS